MKSKENVLYRKTDGTPERKCSHVGFALAAVNSLAPLLGETRDRPAHFLILHLIRATRHCRSVFVERPALPPAPNCGGMHSDVGYTNHPSLHTVLWAIVDKDGRIIVEFQMKMKRRKRNVKVAYVKWSYDGTTCRRTFAHSTNVEMATA